MTNIKAENLTQQTDNVFVYVSNIDGKIMHCALPDQRKEEINNCKNPAVKNQKEKVWSLLCFALKDGLEIDAKEVAFAKTQNGKWVGNKCCFSISHSGGILVAAVSKTPVGVDVEKINAERMNERLAKRILTDSEKLLYKNVAPKNKARFLADAWTVKESIFKLKGEKIFSPSLISANRFKKNLFYFKDTKFLKVKLKPCGTNFLNKRSAFKVKTINVCDNDIVFSLSVATLNRKSIVYRFLGSDDIKSFKRLNENADKKYT